MELSFDDAVIAEGKVSNYLEPGNHKVVVSKIVKGESSQKKSPFIEITVSDESGKTCAQQYYLNGGAWNVSKSAILTIVAAAQNVTADEAKAKLVGLTGDNIDVKLSGILIGKKLAITLNGEWIHPTDTTKKSWVKSQFGSYLFAVPLSDIDKLSKTPYIKGTENANGSTASVNGVVATEKSAWD